MGSGTLPVIQVASSGVDLRFPVGVKQHSAYFCWAACLESLLRSWHAYDEEEDIPLHERAGGRPIMTQHALARAYGETKDRSRFGGLDILSEKALNLLKDFRMHIQVIMPADQLTKYDIDVTLRQWGRFMLCYTNHVPAGTSHAVVPYKTADIPGNWGETFWRMDPAVGQNNYERVSELHRRSVLFLVFTRPLEKVPERIKKA